MAAGELVDVALQMRWAHAVKRAVVASLQHRPEALDAVDMSLIVDILADAVPHGSVVPQAAVGLEIIGEDVGLR